MGNCFFLILINKDAIEYSTSLSFAKTGQQQMKVDYLIVGQGISGTFLSYFLLQAKKKVLVIDNGFPNSPSKIAAGVINPVTGRRLVTVWRADELLPFAWDSYREMENLLQITAISQKNIIDFFPNPFMREGFLKKVSDNDRYTQLPVDENHFTDFFRYDFGYGEVAPAYTVHLETLLPAWRNYLSAQHILLEEHFDTTELKEETRQIHYKDIVADKIIFCDGTTGADNPYFKNLPFAPNKGEALVLEINGLPDTAIYKKTMLLVPYADKNIFWIGSAYAWEFENELPTTAFRNSTEELLNNWLKLPYTILEHRAGLRPATLERRPFVGIHPLHPAIGVLNGMGTKGCSLAPFFAKQLADHLTRNTPIYNDASVDRYAKILSKG